MFKAPLLLTWTHWVLCNSPVSSIPLQQVILHIENSDHRTYLSHRIYPFVLLTVISNSHSNAQIKLKSFPRTWGHVRAVLWLPLPCQLCQAPSCSKILCQALLHLRAYALAFPSLGHFSSISYHGQFLLTAQGFAQAKECHVPKEAFPDHTQKYPCCESYSFLLQSTYHCQTSPRSLCFTCSLSGSPL